MSKKYTKEDIKRRAIRRVATVILEQYEEGSGTHSRIFEVLVSDYLVIDGESIDGNNYREHVVPCCLIRDEARRMYQSGASIDDVVQMIHDNLRIVLISKKEANYIDKTLGLKDTMPDGWEFGTGDPLARLWAGDVKLAE